MSTATLTPFAGTQVVLWGGLLLGLALGALAQASRFCTMGALADWFSFGGTARLGMWVLAASAAALGTQALISLQVFDATRALPWSPRLAWLSCIVGGLLFGVGMVLASGCPQRSLVKAGAGNLKAIVTLLAAGLAAQMTLRGVFAELRTAWLDRWSLALDRPQDLGSLVAPALGAPAGVLRWVLLGIALAAVAAWLWRVRGTLDPVHWIGGLLVGLLVPLAWALTGHAGYLAEHPETLEPAWLGTQSHRPEALTFAAPLAHTLDLLTLWSDKNTTASFGVVVVLGVLAGSLASALWRREFRLESFRTPQDLADHLLGGVLMGFGGVTALGCSIGQGVSGISMLSAGSVLAVAGIVLGARLALRLQERRIERLATAGAA
ncbi:MAG TPA: YeeE/YedE family protein [Albitalea sp.]|nr:YeeE/YedE family protein [Albitalea sp.]